jgi:hypothetical protein
MLLVAGCRVSVIVMAKVVLAAFVMVVVVMVIVVMAAVVIVIVFMVAVVMALVVMVAVVMAIVIMMGGYGLVSVSVVNENFNNGPSPRKCVLECLAKYQTNSQILSPAVGIKLNSKGCRTGPPAYLAWWAGTTTLCWSQLKSHCQRL